MGERTVRGWGRPFSHAGFRGLRPAETGSRRTSSEETAAELPAELRFLAAAGVARRTLARAAERALRHNLLPDEALVSTGAITRDVYDESLAEHLGATWRPEGPPMQGDGTEQPAFDDRGCLLDRFVIAGEGRQSRLYLSVAGNGAGRLLQMLAGSARNRLVAFAPRLKIRRAVGERSRAELARRASDDLARNMPAMSAATRFSPRQATVLLVALGAASMAFLFADRVVWLALGLLFTAYYLGHVALRAELLRRIGDKPGKPPFRPRVPLGPDAPVYTIIVCLYQEAGQVAALAESLSRLDWPAWRLEVLFACEADDGETVAAIEALALPGNFCVLKVPAGAPRTKPRALNYALNFASGDYVVVYDAEDRPAPSQLREAHETFLASEESLACLQAPLAIHNGSQSWLSAMFALEYDVLFRGMLPALAEMGAPLPLGGTSNHFRTVALRKSGGWDAWNMTEDADLGIRLARLGYRCGTIGAPTFEEAPVALLPWLKQRTRWFKGWTQTILVHLRSPQALRADLGWRNYLVFIFFFVTMVVSAVVHPFFLVHTCRQIQLMASGSVPGALDAALAVVSVFNFASGYTVYAGLAREVSRRNSRKRNAGLLLVMLPVYWLLMSLAAWRSVWQFAFQPFLWEKTEHGLAKEPVSAIMVADGGGA